MRREFDGSRREPARRGRAGDPTKPDAEAEDREDQREEPAANVRALAKDSLVVAGALVVVTSRNFACLVGPERETEHAKKERDVRELREAPRTERPGASLLVIRQFAELRRRAGLAEKVPRYVT